MPIKHAFTNPKADGADATVTRPSDWNADHTADTIAVGTTPAASGIIRIPNGQELKSRNTANSADIRMLVVGGGSDIVQVGDTGQRLTLVASAGNLNVGYDVTALGGGAAPTVGTIGGSGPATAAQNSWLKILINGTASFIPVWR